MNRTLLLPFLVSCCVADAQWCIPTTATPYAATMPGITQFTCNTISRSSLDVENYPNNSYVNTGLSTALAKGSTYPVSVSFTIDDVIFPGSHMNLRVWIDLNQDGQLDDVGETLLIANETAGPTYDGTITIPNTAPLGNTRMRVTAKMCAHTGHIVPSPCDLPADPLMYHGELEDYTVEIVESVGIEEGSLLQAFSISSDAVSTIARLTLTESASARLEVLDTSGRLLSNSVSQALGQGAHALVLPPLNEQGVYIGRLWLNGRAQVVRFFR